MVAADQCSEAAVAQSLLIQNFGTFLRLALSNSSLPCLQIGLVRILRLPPQTVIPNNEDDATYIRLILTVCAAELGTDINLEIASVGRSVRFISIVPAAN